MRRKLKNLKNKNGHSENGAPRQLIDEATYREFKNNANVVANTGNPGHWDPQYSGISNATRPRDHNIFLRRITPARGPGPG
jgi:hypothetical protein